MVFPLYLLLIVCPYAFRASGGHYDFAVVLGAWFVAFGHLAMAGEATWNALPGRRERTAVIGWLLTPWVLASVVAFLLTDTGGVVTFKREYLLLTGSCFVGFAQCLGAAGLAAWRRVWGEAQWHALIAGVWFSSSVAVNAASRWIWAQDREAAIHSWRVLNGTEHAVHVLCMGAWGWLIVANWRKT